MEEGTWRGLFPITERYVYLDHAGIAPVSQPVHRAVQHCIEDSAYHGAFHYPAWIQETERTRTLASRILRAEQDEIAFVRNTSHGLSLVARGLPWVAGDNIVVYEHEFPSNLFPWMQLRRIGVEVRFVAAKDGRIDSDTFTSQIDRRTKMVAVSAVQFTNGYRADLEGLGAVCKARGVLLCVDAIQGLGAMHMDVKRCNIDFLSADAHKWLMGPEGIGIFYCRRDLAEQLEPSLIGWKSVRNELAFEEPEFVLKENALRFEEGSQNMAGIAGLGAALNLLLDIGIKKIEERVLDLGEGIIREADKRAFSVLTPRERRERGGIVTILGPFDPATVRARLREKGYMVNVRGGGLRLSPHFYNTEEEIARCFQEIDDACR